ncbi:TolC family protein [Sphingopyxis sp.]|uniref:TolC family protein n=1 Tax=Sphingopyxis sp. TaxID=1908224 RepID=UPI001D2ECF2E|nr:TolC family protein [Sphingopyxis sp.]MBW8294499.1 TolC family protein [Sphingopyxis sp.]
MKMHHLIAMLLVASAPVLAEPGLLPEPAVREALDAHPSVEAAKARIGVAKAEERALKAGPHEVTVSGSYIRRSVDREGEYDEYDATLSRAVRLPGKARLDRKAGAFGVAASENRFEDARHQTALLLNELWWDWLGASAETAVDLQSVSNLQQSLDGVKRRVTLRDAAPLEADQAEAALGTARLAAAQSKGRADFARTRLIAQFPSLALPDLAVELSLPQQPPGGFALLRDQVIARSHEIGAAEAEAARLGVVSERVRRDRIADPSVGLRVFSERNGAERGAGLVLSMPIGGGQRRAQADKSSAEASAALAELAAVRFDVQEMADGDLSRAEAGLSAWRRSREGLDAQVAAVLKMRRGYQLGAIDLADLLLAERQTHDAFRSEAITRTEAMRAITRLRIDSHNLWIGDE